MDINKDAKQTGRTVWDFIANEPKWAQVTGKVVLIITIPIVLLVVGASIGLRAIGFSITSIDVGDKVRITLDKELKRRFAHAYIRTSDLKRSAGENIKEVLRDERGNYKVIFKQPFPDHTYAAVASSTRGFVHVTENTKESVTLVAYDVFDDASKETKLSKTAAADFELTLVVYWPYS